MPHSTRVSRHGGVAPPTPPPLKKDAQLHDWVGVYYVFYFFILTQMFDRHLCWQQLKYSGMLETVKYDFCYF